MLPNLYKLKHHNKQGNHTLITNCTGKLFQASRFVKKQLDSPQRIWMKLSCRYNLCSSSSQVEDDRNGNGCAGTGRVTNQTDLCFPGSNYTVVMPVQQTQERSPAENIQWPFGYFGISDKRTVSPCVTSVRAGKGGATGREIKGESEKGKTAALVHLLSWMAVK